MSAESLDVVRRLFAAVETRDLAGTLAVYHPDIVIREASFLPYGGIHRGHAGAQQHARGFASAWYKSQPGPEKQLDPVYLDASDRILVLFWLKGLAVSTGRRISVPVVGSYRVRDGKVAEAQMFYSDIAEIMQFLADIAEP